MKPFVEIGFMPEALSTQPRPLPARPAARREGESTPGAGLPAEGLRQVARARLPGVGAALRGAVWSRGGRELVVGGLERAQHPLLEGHARGVPQALRLRGRRRAASAAHGPRGRAAHRGRPGRRVPARLPRALPARHEPRDREAVGSPLDFVAFHAKGAPKFVNGHVRMGIDDAAARRRQRLRRSWPRSRSCRKHADRHRRVRPGGLRRLPGARSSPTATGPCTRATPRRASPGTSTSPTSTASTSRARSPGPSSSRTSRTSPASACSPRTASTCPSSTSSACSGG